MLHSIKWNDVEIMITMNSAQAQALMKLRFKLRSFYPDAYRGLDPDSIQALEDLHIALSKSLEKIPKI